MIYDAFGIPKFPTGEIEGSTANWRTRQCMTANVTVQEVVNGVYGPKKSCFPKVGINSSTVHDPYTDRTKKHCVAAYCARFEQADKFNIPQLFLSSYPVIPGSITSQYGMYPYGTASEGTHFDRNFGVDQPNCTTTLQYPLESRSQNVYKYVDWEHYPNLKFWTGTPGQSYAIPRMNSVDCKSVVKDFGNVSMLYVGDYSANNKIEMCAYAFLLFDSSLFYPREIDGSRPISNFADSDLLNYANYDTLRSNYFDGKSQSNKAPFRFSSTFTLRCPTATSNVYIWDNEYNWSNDDTHCKNMFHHGTNTTGNSQGRSPTNFRIVETYDYGTHPDTGLPEKYAIVLATQKLDDFYRDVPTMFSQISSLGRISMPFYNAGISDNYVRDPSGTISSFALGRGIRILESGCEVFFTPGGKG